MLKESKTSKSEKQNKKIDSSLKSKEKKSNCLENCSSPEKFKEKILTWEISSKIMLTMDLMYMQASADKD